MHEEYEYIAEDLGDPLAQEPFSEEELSYLQGRVPPALYEFMATMGHSIFLDGGLTLCPPKQFASILALVFKGDQDLHHRDCTLISYSAFGVLGVWSQTHGNLVIDLPLAVISSPSLAPSEFPANMMPPPIPGGPDPDIVSAGTIRLEPDEYDFLDFKGDQMLKPAVTAHGPLELGQCYGFFPALGLAGSESIMRNVAQLQRVSALEHFALLAQLQPFHLTKFAEGGIQRVREIG